MTDVQTAKISEAAWVNLKLNIDTLQEKTSSTVVKFDYDDSTKKVKCLIWDCLIQNLINTQADQVAQLTLYEAMVDQYYHRIAEVLHQISIARTEFNIDRDIKFEICGNYGEDFRTICEFNVQGVVWNERTLS
jgi:hypothetical protein